jgi:hypothetical protein
MSSFQTMTMSFTYIGLQLLGRELISGDDANGPRRPVGWDHLEKTPTCNASLTAYSTLTRLPLP